MNLKDGVSINFSGKSVWGASFWKKEKKFSFEFVILHRHRCEEAGKAIRYMSQKFRREI